MSSHVELDEAGDGKTSAPRTTSFARGRCCDRWQPRFRWAVRIFCGLTSLGLIAVGGYGIAYYYNFMQQGLYQVAIQGYVLCFYAILFGILGIIAEIRRMPIIGPFGFLQNNIGRGIYYLFVGVSVLISGGGITNQWPLQLVGGLLIICALFSWFLISCRCCMTNRGRESGSNAVSNLPKDASADVIRAEMERAGRDHERAIADKDRQLQESRNKIQELTEQGLIKEAENQKKNKELNILRTQLESAKQSGGSAPSAGFANFEQPASGQQGGAGGSGKNMAPMAAVAGAAFLGGVAAVEASPYANQAAKQMVGNIPAPMQNVGRAAGNTMMAGLQEGGNLKASAQQAGWAAMGNAKDQFQAATVDTATTAKSAGAVLGSAASFVPGPAGKLVGAAATGLQSEQFAQSATRMTDAAKSGGLQGLGAEAQSQARDLGQKGTNMAVSRVSAATGLPEGIVRAAGEQAAADAQAQAAAKMAAAQEAVAANPVAQGAGNLFGAARKSSAGVLGKIPKPTASPGGFGSVRSPAPAPAEPSGNPFDSEL